MKGKRSERRSKGTSLFLVLILLVSVFFGVFVGRKIPSAKQVDILSALSSVSAILLGVFGVWIGTIKAPSMSSLEGGALRKAAKEVIAEEAKFRVVYRGVLVSAACALMVLAMHLAIPIVNSIEKTMGVTLILRMAAFAFIAALVFLQIWVVLSAISPMQSLKHELTDLQSSAKSVLENMSEQDDTET